VLDGFVGSASRPHLEPVAEQDEDGQHGGGFIEHVTTAETVTATD